MERRGTIHPEDLSRCLRRSGLELAVPTTEAASRIEGRLRVDGVVATDQLRATYEVRLRRLVAARSAHAEQLYDSTREFVRRMDDAPAELVGVDIADAPPFRFLVFMTPDPVRALGCMRIADRRLVCESDWRALWGEDPE